MESFLTVIISVAAGAFGYLIAVFWISPILRYREIKYRLTSDVIFYANAISLKGIDDEFKKRVWDRVVATRRHCSDLSACFPELPGWYKWCLQKRKEFPERAHSELMGLSNTFESEPASQRVDKIKEFLRIKPWGM